MNVVSGRIVVKESGVGIPDLLVVLNDVDPGTKPEESIPSAEGGGSAPVPASAVNVPPVTWGADRLASILTDADGRFSVTYEDAEFQVRNEDEKRPDLQIVVLAPEEPGVTFDSRVLYRSMAVRQNSARTESYLIRLTSALLAQAGIPVPSSATLQVEPPTDVASRLGAIETWHSDVVDGSIAAARVRVDSHRARFAAFTDLVRPTLATSLSSVPTSFHDADRFVVPGESVFEKSHATIVKNLTEIVNKPEVRSPVRGILTLAEEQVTDLRAQADTNGFVTAEALAGVTGRSGPESFAERADVTAFCRATTADEKDCVAMLDEPQPTPEPTPGPEIPHVPGPNVAPVTDADVPVFMARVMDTMTSPEEQLEIGLMPTASRETVDASIGSLTFRPSPADVPAFQDYTQLQIAFRHVWQEAIDEGVLNIAEDAYQTVVELGGSPEVIGARGADAVSALLSEGRAALAASRVVRDHRGDQPLEPPSSAPGGVVVTSTPGSSSGAQVRDHRGDSNAPVVRDHRTDSAPVVRDHRGGTSTGTSTGDPVDRLPSLLVELQKRLQGTYAFTVFAANRKERSVNFGLLNTYRQLWKPLSYQAGPLVKSIPLAPKQTQKITVTRKVHRKRSLRELENNLRSVREEMSDTSRAEEEIVRRTSSKSTFSMSNTVSGSIDVFSGSHTNAFTQDAGKNSDDTRKSLHESTFKVAQEVKDERTTEVNTEVSEDLETTETTEISNPNDEIAVTFLLYELQRRYRVHERLHRVRPVVLVAQETPAPHDIDIDWLVVHDWIIKRALLDDSFLPALSWLTKTSGEETAVAELKFNVDQQRAIVDELREEVAVARRNAEAQNALLERAVFQKAVPSQDGGGGGLFGFVSDIANEVVDLGEGVISEVGDLIFGGDADQNASNRQAMEDAAQRAADQARDLMFRMEREVTALNALMESYAKAVSEHYDHLTDIARLQVHVMDNILYYMQAIWTYEPPDQRFFRLHTVPVPIFKPTQRRFRIDFDAPLEGTFAPAHTSLPRFGGRNVRGFAFEADTEIDPTLEFAPLSEVADLDNLLGFKGNYMIFPLLESNALTDFMMDPYVDQATGDLLDPSDSAVMTLDEFADYVCCLKSNLTDDEFESLREELKRQYQELLTAPNRTDDILVVPTNSLFIEALPAAETLLEPYKKVHRFEDAKKAQEEVRSIQLESIRKVARLLAGEREDPNIDKRVLIEGDTANIVVDGS